MFEFSQETSKLLHNAGWYEDRESLDVSEYIKTLERAGFHVSDAVKDFLYHFGGLSVKHPHAKIKEKTDTFHFDVIKALNSGDPSWVLEEYSSRINQELCIIGEAFRRSLILCMSPDKRVYAGIDDALFLVGESGELAIEALCQGLDLKEIPEQDNDEVERLKKDTSKFFGETMYPTVRVKKSGEKKWLDKSFPVTDEQLALGFEKWQHRLPTDKRYTNAVQYKGRYYVPRYVLKSAIEEEVKRRFNLGYDDFRIENSEKAFDTFRKRGWDIEFIKNFKWPVRRTDRGLCIAGTRITLYSIMDYVKAGHPPEMIRDHFRLTPKQTADVLKYIEDYQEKFAAEYQQVLKDSEEIRQYWEERNRDRLEKIRSMPPKPEKEHLYAKLKAAKARLGME